MIISHPFDDPSSPIVPHIPHIFRATLDGVSASFPQRLLDCPCQAIDVDELLKSAIDVKQRCEIK